MDERTTNGDRRGEKMNVLFIIISGFLFSVVQQPNEDMTWVTPVNNQFTEYTLTDELDTEILFAHNYLAGKKLYTVSVGDEIGLVYSDKTDVYTIVEKNREINQDHNDLVNKYYYNGGLILQTCIRKGFLFLVGEYEYSTK